MGCVRRIGCLVILLAAIAAGFIYRDRIAALYHRLRGTPQPPAIVFVAPAPASAAQAEAALDRLAQRGGPAYVDLTAAQLAGLIERQLSVGPRPVVDSVTVALSEGRVAVRGSLDVSVLPRKLLGPLAAGLGAREPVTAGGTLSASPQGGVWWTIDALKIRDFPIPRSVIPALLRAIGLPGERGSAVPLPLASGVGDVRVSPSAVRAYRASPR